MHCDACKKLITMELEEIGLEHAIDRFEVGENNTGTLFLREGVSDDDVEKITARINAMGEYRVL